jgi:BirA family transcriptional regulator, biotin operon repressor / biotin---[acetyl-CoA-carboxylase] ligase
LPQPSNTNLIGSTFIELQSIDSTNNYARQQIHASLAQNGTAIFSHEQVAGKGQRGRFWASERNLNIALSIIIKPLSIPLTAQFQLSACAAVSVQEVFQKYIGEACKIKWPNDLYWQDRKAGGILIESIVSSGESGTGNWEWAIIGIGININQTTFPADLPNPVSLKQITGQEYDPILIAKEICSSLDKNYQHLVTAGFDSIYEAYNLNLYKRNNKVKLKKDNRLFDATIKKVSPSGQLITEHGIEEVLDFGAVEWII